MKRKTAHVIELSHVMAAALTQSQSPSVSVIVRCLLSDFDSREAAIKYAERIGQTGGPLASDYRQAASVLARKE